MRPWLTYYCKYPGKHQVCISLDSGQRVLLPGDRPVQQRGLLQGEEGQRGVVPAHQLGRRVQVRLVRHRRPGRGVRIPGDQLVPRVAKLVRREVSQPLVDMLNI